jgi:16S rRNA (cytidine1402-2'-O)-methyltransferase
MAAKPKWYNTLHPATMPGTLFLVATPIGNLEDMTFRAVRVLREVAIIAAEDTRRTATLLAHYQIETPTTSLHNHNERSRVPAVLKRLMSGQDVAVVTDAGMPSIADPGYLVAKAAIDAGIRVDVIPGASALTMAIAGSGLPADFVSFVGFAPARAGERARFFKSLSDVRGTVVLFESPHRLPESLAALRQFLGDRPIAVAHELTKLHESWHRGYISELLGSKALPEKGEFTIVVGAESRADRRATSSQSPTVETISVEFGDLTKTLGLDRREALAELARRHRLPKRAIYSLVEQGKNRLNDQ